jgi:hypothetical protein
VPMHASCGPDCSHSSTLVRLSLVTAKLEIRPGSDADLAALVAALGERDFFTDHLARQQRGRENCSTSSSTSGTSPYVGSGIPTR